MELVEAYKKIREQMDKHELHDWLLSFAHNKYIACCKHKSKVIEFNTDWIPAMNDESLIDTALHEIAHALVGRGERHGFKWMKKCIEIGCRPTEHCDFLTREDSTKQNKWSLVCPSCGCTIEASEENLDNMSICPNCNQIMDDGGECPNCGYDLGSDFD